MTFKSLLFILIIAVTFVDLQGQTPTLTKKSYSVDKQIDFQIKKLSWVDTGVLKNSMTIKVTQNNKPFFNQTLDCYTSSFLVKDTIYITGYMLGKAGWGFQLVLFKDSCIAGSFALSDAKIYKYNKSDKDSSDYILLPNISQKVILTKKPAFQNDEIVSGLIELKSIPYFYSIMDGIFAIDIKAFFKTAKLKEVQ